MYSITASLFAGSPEEQTYFPALHPVTTVEQALLEIHGGHAVLLVNDAWLADARLILQGLGAPVTMVDEVLARAVEFRRIPA